MLLSCKLSNTVLQYLEQRGEDLTPLLDAVSLHEEFLRDPSYWMKASEMEAFLELVTRLPWRTNEENMLQKMAHSAVQLRSWGVLDSVLRMMPRPQEILAQPSRFLANFISPEPPVERIVREESGLSFDLPITAEKYPLAGQFLKWSFETLPVYVGKELAVCEWQGIRLNLRWDSRQKSMFEVDQGHQVSPELMRQIVASLEKHQHELQKKNSELQARNDQLEAEKNAMQEQARQNQIPELSPTRDLRYEVMQESSVEHLRQSLSRLTDAFVRAQQLVTLLIGQDRMSLPVKEAIRRVDWERVKQQYPKTIEECFDILEKTKEQKEQQEKRRVRNH